MASWSHGYVQKLAAAGKYSLMIWPFHCLDGAPGINLVSQLHDALMFHAAARHAQPVFIHKGFIPETEFYSPLEPEVEVTDVPGGTINAPVLNILSGHETIIVAGEAKSHCVLSFMESLVRHWQNQPDVLRRIIFLSDCTSSVASPAVDFEAIASRRLAEMSSQYGIRLMKSTDVNLWAVGSDLFLKSDPIEFHIPKKEEIYHV